MWKVLKSAVVGNVAFYICMAVSIILMTVSFFLPPTGEISSSVMMSVGELFLYPALGAVLTAMEKGVPTKIKHKDTTFTIGDDKKEEEDQD